MKKIVGEIFKGVVHHPEKLGRKFVNALGQSPPPRMNQITPKVKGNSVELPVLSQDPSIRDLPMEKFPVDGVHIEKKPDIGTVLSDPKALSYIDGTIVAKPGQIYPLGDPRFDQQMALAVVTKLHDLYENLLGRSLEWAQGQKQILIQVRAGEEPNSDYMTADPTSTDPMEQLNRVQLYGFFDPIAGKMIYAAESKEVTAHEGGHGLTDSLRPTYSLSFNLESLAFHEGQSDVDAMIMDLQSQNLMGKVIQQTGGDLSKHNYLSDLGEEFGIGISHLEHLSDPFIRTANNDPKVFRMQDWRKLPFYSRKGLASEPHTFSEIWSGTWYDNLKDIYTYFSKTVGMQPSQALNQASQIMSSIAVRAFDFAPVGSAHFNALALAQLKALKTDFSSSPHFQELEKILEKNFINRGILSQKEIQDWKQHESLIPPLNFSDSSINRASATRWLASNADALRKFDPSLTPEILSKMKFIEAYTNNKGETFFNFVRIVPASFTEDDLKDPALAPIRGKLLGQKIPMFGGLTLGFNKEGKLFVYVHDKAPEKEIQDTKDYILKLIQERVISFDGEPGASKEEAVSKGNKTPRVLGTFKNPNTGASDSLRRTSICTGFKTLRFWA
jgi:hypothetical protein